MWKDCTPNKLVSLADLKIDRIIDIKINKQQAYNTSDKQIDIDNEYKSLELFLNSISAK